MASEGDSEFDNPELPWHNPKSAFHNWPHAHLLAKNGHGQIVSLTIKGSHPFPCDYVRERECWHLPTVEVCEEHFWYVGLGWFRLRKREDLVFTSAPADYEEIYFKADDIISIVTHSKSPYPPKEQEESRWEKLS